MDKTCKSAILCRKDSLKLQYLLKYRYGTFKPKKNQYSRAKRVTNSDRALEHFDLHYQPVYRDLWPSIRISLLSAKKMCAVMNNFALENKFAEEFLRMGTYDMILQACSRQNLNEQPSVQHVDNHYKDVKQVQEKSKVVSSVDDIAHGTFYSGESEHSSFQLNDSSNSIEMNRKDLDRTNLYNFVPAEIVYSETQQLQKEEAKRSIFTPTDVKVDIVKPKAASLPRDLHVMTFPAGDVTEFPDVKSDKPNGHLCFYLMDAASVLPVIALDIEKGDNVLDLCAAPGGKALTILQTKLPEGLTCNDLSSSRLSRLQNILRFYLPQEKRGTVKTCRRSGLDFSTPEYDKVLVDVPCNTDRHVLLDSTNNLFSPIRIQERIEMPDLQKDLLLSGIKSCRSGGRVVYSTCTLSPAQNDGVVQSALEELWRESDIQVVVEDLGEITDLFQDTFRFYNNCRFGQLVLPSLPKNFGPMYFCRIRRVS